MGFCFISIKKSSHFLKDLLRSSAKSLICISPVVFACECLWMTVTVVLWQCTKNLLLWNVYAPCVWGYTHTYTHIFLSGFIWWKAKSRYTFVNQRNAQNFIVFTHSMIFFLCFGNICIQKYCHLLRPRILTTIFHVWQLTCIKDCHEHPSSEHQINYLNTKRINCDFFF